MTLKERAIQNIRSVLKPKTSVKEIASEAGVTTRTIFSVKTDTKTDKNYISYGLLRHLYFLKNKENLPSIEMLKSEAKQYVKDMTNPKISPQEIADKFGLTYKQLYNFLYGILNVDEDVLKEMEKFKP